MCMVSVVSDYGRAIPAQQWNWNSFNEFQQILKKLEELDKKLDQPDCHDSAKAEWMKEVEDRLRKLESPQTITWTVGDFPLTGHTSSAKP